MFETVPSLSDMILGAALVLVMVAVIVTVLDRGLRWCILRWTADLRGVLLCHRSCW